MEMIHVWALAGGLGAAALAATLKAVGYRHELKLANEVIARLRKEMDALNEKHAKSITDSQELHTREKGELSKRIADCENKLLSHDVGPFEPRTHPD